MSEVKWIKLCTDVFNDEKIKILETMPEGKTLICIWLKLLCLAGKTNLCGWICMADKIPYTESMLAAIFREDVAMVRIALKTFEEFEMVEYSEDGVLGISNWNKHQKNIGIDKVREDNRKRQAEFRKRKDEPLIPNELFTDNSNSVDYADKIKENDVSNKESSDIVVTEKHPKKQTNAILLKNMINEYTIDDKIRELLMEFVALRKSKKKHLTERAMKMALKELTNLSGNDVELQQKIIEQTLYHCWDSFYALKSNYNGGCYKTAKQQSREEFADFMQGLIEGENGAV